MLLNHFDAMSLADNYADFMSILADFRVYCISKKSRRKTDYIKKFDNLEGIYEHVFPKKERFPWIDFEIITPTFKKIKRILSTKRITDQNIDEIGLLLYDLQIKLDGDMRLRLFEFTIEKDIKRYYPEKLYQAIYTLMDNGEYESAVFAAFKYLDSHLKSLLGAKSNEYYGEELINFAFSPKSGALQLQSHPNEQNGIRNFFSGANAIFRNPSAHRFVNYDDKTAEAIIAMVAMMANLASEIKENIRPKRK